MGTWEQDPVDTLCTITSSESTCFGYADSCDDPIVSHETLDPKMGAFQNTLVSM